MNEMSTSSSPRRPALLMGAVLATALTATPIARAEPGAPETAAQTGTSVTTPTPAVNPKAPSERGLGLVSPDGRHRLRVGGQLQGDALTFPGDSAGLVTDDLRLRRARLDLRATLASRYRLRLNADFAGSQLNLVDAYIELEAHEALRVRIGKDKSPVSFDRLQSSTVMHFLERGATNQTAPNRELGVQLLGRLADGLLDYQVGAFVGAPDGASSVESNADDRFDLEGRLTVTPFATTSLDALRALRLGASFSYGLARGSSTAPQLGAGFRTAGRATWFRYARGSDANTTAHADGERVRVGGHLLWELGPVLVFGELIASSQVVRLGAALTTVDNLGWSSQLSVLLTGEDASWSRTRPGDPLADGGPGALELALRFGGIDIDREAFERGLADPTSPRAYRTLAVGLNWYLDEQVKLQLNWERAMFTGALGSGAPRDPEDLLGLRVQYIF